MINTNQFDVIIIGGSYAGLSATMALGRSLKKVLVIDSGLPCNRYTPHAHNFITHDGATPSEIAAKAKADVLRYPSVSFITDRAEKGVKTSEGFTITTKAGLIAEAHSLIFATGVKDQLPAIEGFEQCWGKTIIHCPYCHGYEFRNQPTGLMANGDRAVHLAMVIHNLTKDLRIFTNGAAGMSAEQLELLATKGIEVIDKEIAAVAHNEGMIQALQFQDGSTQLLPVLYAALPFEQHCSIPQDLGCELTDTGHIRVDAFQRTSVPGIYACGDCSGMMRSLAAATAAGNLAGAMANNDSLVQQF